MKNITKISILGILTALSSQSFAQEYYRVLSSTPIISQSFSPQTICKTEYVNQKYNQPSGEGILIGSVVGGLIGNNISNHNKSSNTIGGVIAGAVIGSAIGSNSNNVSYQSTPVQRCYTQTVSQNNINGYRVTYDRNGYIETFISSTNPGEYISSPIPMQIQPSPTIVYSNTTYTPYVYSNINRVNPIIIHNDYNRINYRRNDNYNHDNRDNHYDRNNRDNSHGVWRH